MFVKLGSWLVGVVVRLYSPRMPGHGFLFHLVSAIFPSLRDYARDRAVGHGRGGWGLLRACCWPRRPRPERESEEEEMKRLDLNYAELTARRAVNIIKQDTHYEKKKRHQDRRLGRSQLVPTSPPIEEEDERESLYPRNVE